MPKPTTRPVAPTATTDAEKERAADSQAARLGQWMSLCLGIYLLPIGIAAALFLAWSAGTMALWLLAAAALDHSSVVRNVADSHRSVLLFPFGVGPTATPFAVLVAMLYVAAVVGYFAHVATDRRWKAPGWQRNFVLRQSWMFRRGMRGYFPHHVYMDTTTTVSTAAAADGDDGGDAVVQLLLGTRVDVDEATPSAAGLAAIDAACHQLFHPVAADGAPARYLFCCHPHGLFSMGVWCTFGALNEGIRRVFHQRGFVTTIHTMAANFTVPMWREMLLSFPFSNSDRSTMHRAMTPATGVGAPAARAMHLTGSGATARLRPLPSVPGGGGVGGRRGSSNNATSPRVSVLVPGGAEESLRCTEDKLTLRKRKGFVRVALETGASLVPVYTFGESALYEPLTRHQGFMKWLMRMQKRIGVGTPLVIGDAWWNAVVPKRANLRTVIGKPIDSQRFWRRSEAVGPHPHFTDADVDALHAEYMLALQQLYRKYQPAVAPGAPAMFEIVS